MNLFAKTIEDALVELGGPVVVDMVLQNVGRTSFLVEAVEDEVIIATHKPSATGRSRMINSNHIVELLLPIGRPSRTETVVIPGGVYDPRTPRQPAPAVSEADATELPEAAE
ncbi:hypothetical protein [Roseococcus pinisoli]|uniref:Uncharacterized protein n=1 Tax=Roseococcus pinisoli TaxID=2835040 RepID=A0ABS5QFV5_9PROT|nr:hypothetical protein [Roseococcus pinisoli]MBS7812383.1 hypothetical protein [Roseococcus pinisoli]